MGSLSLPPTNIHRRSCALRRRLHARVLVAAEEEVRHLCRLFPSGQKTKDLPLPAISRFTCQFTTAGIYSEPQAIMHVEFDYQHDARLLVKHYHVSFNVPSHTLSV